MTTHPPAPPDLEPPDGRDYWSATPPWYAVLAGGAIFLTLIVVLALLIADDDSRIQTVAPTLTSVGSTTDPGSAAATNSSAPTTDSQASSSTSSTSTSTPTTATSSTTGSTTIPSTTAPPTTVDEGPFASAVWPWFQAGVRYVDPVAVARGFAEDFVGFEQPVVGPFRQGDRRSGEVELRPSAGGPVTTVFVRQLGPNDTWWVIGAATEHIVVEEPGALDEVDNPLRVSGEALAFEGVVDVELRADGESTPLVTGNVLGGATELEPFEGRFVWTNPGEGSGAVLFLIRSMDEGGVSAASVVRVAFASG